MSTDMHYDGDLFDFSFLKVLGENPNLVQAIEKGFRESRKFFDLDFNTPVIIKPIREGSEL